MIEALFSLYSPAFPSVLVYMLQNTEYQTGSYLKWFWRTQNFSKVMTRRQLEQTRAAKSLLLVLRMGMALQVALGLSLLYVGITENAVIVPELGAILILSYPIVWAHLIVVPLILGRIFIVDPKTRKRILESEAIFANHPGTTIAVAGSYGKTSMKELLATVLSEGKKVAVTPANKNVASSHAMFARSLKGDEDVLVIEYGEAKVGDVRQFAETTHPNIGIITGIAPAHLDQYPTLEAAANDIFELANYLQNEATYINSDSETARNHAKDKHRLYNVKGVDGWKVTDVKIDYEGTRFTLSKANQKLHLKSKLLGEHHIGPLSLAAILGLELGLTKAQIEAGVAKTHPFEHRMQPRSLGGAWIIDDTYNGNIDGIRAGLKLLSELSAKRKIYVTPGLVDQGIETANVHREMGKLIAEAKPDKTVLMKNSATAYILEGLKTAGYTGEIQIEDEPLKFYTNLEHIVAHGDLILMQNDWTDNYA